MSGTPLSDTGEPGGPAARRSRLDLVDAARGGAIIGVVIYHFFWDLSHFWLIETDVSIHPVWVAFARGLLASFVGLVGVSLVLAHGETIRWRAFWRRFALIAGAALLVSAGSFVFFPDSFIYFGVLHAIALFSLLGLGFLRMPVPLVLGLGVAMIAAPFAFTHEAFTERALSWIGFWEIAPLTNDLVPVFPWFGVTLLGIGLTRIARAGGSLERLGRWRGDGGIGRLLVLAGRWSLVIYLVHQPVLMGALYPVANVLAPDAVSRNAFNRTCATGCLNTGSDAAWCAAYCDCALEEIEQNDLWDVVESPAPTAEQSQRVSELVLQCSAELVDLLPQVAE